MDIYKNLPKLIKIKWKIWKSNENGPQSDKAREVSPGETDHIQTTGQGGRNGPQSDKAREVSTWETDHIQTNDQGGRNVGLWQPRPESAYLLFKLEVKLKENWCGAAQARICLISIEIVIKYKRKLPWGSPGQNQLDFYLNFNQK